MTTATDSCTRYFPYPRIRPGQDQFIKAIFETVEEGRSIVIEGCNGLGKTAAVLSACLPKATEDNLKIVYLARTHRQHERVIEELKTISKKEQVSGISIRGRNETCLNELVKNNPGDAKANMELCELLKSKHHCGYYNNIEEKKNRFLRIQGQISSHPYKASEIQQICENETICPYELTKASLTEMTVVALSYLYIFDPAIRTSFLRNIRTSLDRMILIVDEGHNLPETAAEIASRTMTLFTVKQAEIEAKELKHKEIVAFARTFRNQIETIARNPQKELVLTPQFLMTLLKEKCELEEPRQFFEHLYALGNAIRKSLLLQGRYPRSFIHAMADFMLKWLETTNLESYICLVQKYTSRRGLQSLKLEVVALDPSEITEPVFSEAFSNVVISGTLQPFEAYIQTTKLPGGITRRVLPAPFPKDHVLPLICKEVTTAMQNRTSEMYHRIVHRIREVVENTPANTGIFAASFDVVQSLLNSELEADLDKPLFCEQRSMKSGENELKVAQFKAFAERGGAVFLGVQGGRSSEGVDYPGNQMNSVIVLGIPYAEPTPKVKAQIDFYERKFPGHGREYSYVIPAMKKASQAAGRPIRTLEDRAAIFFFDRRFSHPYCRQFLPNWIREDLRVLPEADGVIASELSVFFKKAS